MTQNSAIFKREKYVLYGTRFIKYLSEWQRMMYFISISFVWKINFLQIRKIYTLVNLAFLCHNYEIIVNYYYNYEFLSKKFTLCCNCNFNLIIFHFGYWILHKAGMYCFLIMEGLMCTAYTNLGYTFLVSFPSKNSVLSSMLEA